MSLRFSKNMSCSFQVQPCGLNTLSVDGGYLANVPAGRMGLRSSSPPQLGQMPLSLSSVQLWQKVHSNEQMRADSESGGRSTLQHSQPGLRASMAFSPWGCGYCIAIRANASRAVDTWAKRSCNTVAVRILMSAALSVLPSGCTMSHVRVASSA